MIPVFLPSVTGMATLIYLIAFLLSRDNGTGSFYFHVQYADTGSASRYDGTYTVSNGHFRGVYKYGTDSIIFNGDVVSANRMEGISMVASGGGFSSRFTKIQ